MSRAEQDPANQSVTVVIPTVGRPTLNRAIRSALDQENISVEVIVVWDGDTDGCGLAQLEYDWGNRIRVVLTGASVGGARARDLGTRAGSGSWVAYLDDDDQWAPRKLSLQLNAVSSDRDLVSCRLANVSAVSGSRGGTAPRDVYDQDVDMAEWLFLNRALWSGRNIIQTSTIFMRREFALSIRWYSGLRRHEDWDFVLRAVNEHGARVVQLTEVLTLFSVGSANSMTNRSAWGQSMDFFEIHSAGWGNALKADFLMGQPLRYALQGRDWAAARSILTRLARVGRPSWRATLLGLAGLLPRRKFDAILTVLRPTRDQPRE